MKYSLIFIVSILLFASCNKGVQVNSLKELKTNLVPEVESFIINPNEDIYIEGQQGTVIFFPASSLVYDDGTLVKNEVKVNLQEFYSNSEIISNNLSTLSDSLFLETGGMIKIEAIANGEALHINPSKSYVVCFPGKNNENMELFYGDFTSNNTINWEIEDIANYEDTNTEDYTYTKRDTTLIPKYIGVSCWSGGISKPNGLDCNFNWEIKHKDSTLFRYIKNLYKDSIDLKNQMTESNLRVEMKLKIANNGKVKSINFDTITVFNSRIEKVINSLPLFDMNKMYCEPVYEYSLCIGITDQIDRDEYAKKFNDKYSRYKNKAIEYVDKKELEYYVLSATKLDWINCDRFIEEESDRLDFLVSVNNPRETSVVLIFNDFKGIMNGVLENDTFIFNQIPKDVDINVIAISHEEGKPKMAKVSTSSGKAELKLNDFKTFSLDELKEELNTIN